MDLNVAIFCAITIIQIVIGGFLAFLIMKMYLATRYRPTALLAIFFIIFTVDFLIFVPVFWIPLSGELFARILSDISGVLIFMMFPFLIMAIEGMKGHIISPISTVTIGLTAYVMGFLSIVPPRWDYIFDVIWWQVFHADLDIALTLYVFVMVCFISYRLFQFVREKGTARSKKYPIIAMIGFIGAVIGAIVSYILEIQNVDYLAILIGTAIVAFAYLKDPSSFFISNTNIKTIMFVDNKSNMPFLTLGQADDKNIDLAAAGLGGVMILLQEILESEQPPTRLIHADKGFLIEYDTTMEVSAVIVVDQINDMLRPSLRYALKLFISQYNDEIKTWHGNIDPFIEFEPKLRDIFKFVMPS